MLPSIERDIEELNPSSNLEDELQYQKIINEMQNFLSEPYNDFQIPDFPFNLLYKNTNDNFEISKSEYSKILVKFNNYLDLRNKCFEQMKKLIPDTKFQANSNMRILIIVPSEMKKIYLRDEFF